MVEIVFGGGETLRVTEQLHDVLHDLSIAAQGVAIDIPEWRGQGLIHGFAVMTPERGEQVYVNPGAVAYVRP